MEDNKPNIIKYIYTEEERKELDRLKGPLYGEDGTSYLSWNIYIRF